MNLMVITNQKPTLDTGKKEKGLKHGTKENHQTTREEIKKRRKEQKRTTKKKQNKPENK